jgi:serine/threonine protein kinase
MHFDIDRRAGRDVHHFCVVNTRYYETLDAYAPRSSEYKDIIVSYLPPDWTLIYQRLWYHARPPHGSMPSQGFKIHLSAISSFAEDLLRDIIPMLVTSNVRFKVVADPFMLDYVNSKNFPRGASGKFITIYPVNEQDFRVLIERLYEATAARRGPYILSDKPYRDSRIVFYRYGGFIARHRLTIFGERLPIIRNGQGMEVADRRLPAFSLPEGIADPFDSSFTRSEPTPDRRILLKDRYLVESAITISNSGGVYKGIDRDTGRKVIIKEARPYIGSARGHCDDAVDVLKKEARALVLLEETGVAPRRLDTFYAWDHYFLVEEYIEGIPLSSYRADERWALTLGHVGDHERVINFCTLLCTIGLNLLRALSIIHCKGLIVGDLSPQNIIIDQETLKLTIVDFECACVQNTAEQQVDSMFTPGFASRERRQRGSLSVTDDHYAAGCVLYSLISPATAFFDLKPDAKRLFLERLSEEYGLPPNINEAILTLMDGSCDRASGLLSSKQNLKRLANRQTDNIRPQDIKQLIAGITRYIESTADYARTDRLWPADYRVFTTNPLNISYGALGISLYLKQELGTLPDELHGWIRSQTATITKGEFAPGLYVGLSGMAWALSELGFEEEAVGAMKAAYRSQLLMEGWDVFYGCSGVGLASLYFWGKTKSEYFLEEAKVLGNHLLRTVLGDGERFQYRNVDGGCYYGYAHGASGIALFLLYLHKATEESRYLECAQLALEYEIARSIEREGGLTWGRGPDDKITFPYWRFGSSGVGSVLIRFHDALHIERYRELAAKAALYSIGKYGLFPGQFFGLSGVGEFFIDMYNFTGDPAYIDEAKQIIKRILLYRIDTEIGTAFPGDDLLRISNDLGTGSAGVGLFLSRFLKRKDRLFCDFEIPVAVEAHSLIMT